MGPFSPSAAAELFEQVLSGIEAAHAMGIVHRDLKPENIFCVREANRLSVKILDFGLAKFRPTETIEAVSTITEAGAVIGTVGYMAPEQLSGSEVNPRTDIFALGVILVEVLTGQRPFHSNTYAELLKAVLLDTYHLPGSSPEILAVDAVVQRCLAKQSRDRVASASEFREALIPVLRRCPPIVKAAHA